MPRPSTTAMLTAASASASSSSSSTGAVPRQSPSTSRYVPYSLGEAGAHLRIAQRVRQQLEQHPVHAVVRRDPLAASRGSAPCARRRHTPSLISSTQTYIGDLEQAVDERRHKTGLAAEVVGDEGAVGPGLMLDGRHGEIRIAALCEDGPVPPPGCGARSARGSRRLQVSSPVSRRHRTTGWRDGE